jgi:hypothetical protein
MNIGSAGAAAGPAAGAAATGGAAAEEAAVEEKEEEKEESDDDMGFGKISCCLADLFLSLLIANVQIAIHQVFSIKQSALTNSQPFEIQFLDIIKSNLRQHGFPLLAYTYIIAMMFL